MDNGDGPAVDLDAVDIELLKRVESDFDVNLEALADDLDLSKSAVHYRLTKLREAGVIEGVTADLDPAAFGLEMTMITNVTVTHEEGYSEAVGKALADVPGVIRVFYTMGNIDFVVLSRLQNRDQMNRLIDDFVAIDGVIETASHFVMKEIKDDDRTLAHLSPDMRSAVVEED